MSHTAFPEFASGIHALLEAAINRALRLDPDWRDKLAPLTGRRIGLQLDGLGQRFVLYPHEAGIRVMGAPDDDLAAHADAVLRGTPLALAGMALQEGNERALFSGEVRIEGDVELGQQFRRLLDELDVDWEEALSRVTGDVVAHHLGRALRGLGEWGGQALDTLAQSATEYLQVESGINPRREEVTAFVAEVDTLRNDVERLAARVRRLQEQRSRQSH